MVNDMDQDGEAADGQLIERALAGDRDAFYRLVHRYERGVYWAAFALVGNADDAEEITQETFLKSFRHLHHFRGESKFSTWLTQIAVNEARMRLRKHRPGQHESLDTPADSEDQDWKPRQIADWSENPEERYAHDELRRILTAAIQSLPDIYRSVLVMRDALPG